MKHRPSVKVFHDIDYAFKSKTTKRKVIEKLKGNHVFCVKVHILEVVYD